MAGPLWWRGEGKGLASKEKKNFILVLLPFKNNNYFSQYVDNLSKYVHITLKLVGRYFYWAFKIFSNKNRAILVVKKLEGKNLSQSVSEHFMKKKNLNQSYCH